MAMSFVAAGTLATGAGGLQPNIPAHAANDIIIMIAAVKPDTSTIVTPSPGAGTGVAWVDVPGTDATGGFGAQAADTGPCHIKMMSYVDPTGTLVSGVTTNGITFGSASSTWAQCLVFRSATGSYDVNGASGTKNTGGTPYNPTMTSDPGLTVGDVVAIGVVIPTDLTTPAEFSAETLAATGITSTVTEVSEPDNLSGNDTGGVICRATIDSGTASSNATFSATAAVTNTNTAGPCAITRIREAAAAAVTNHFLAALGVGA